MAKIEVSLNAYEYDALVKALRESGKNLYEEIDKIVLSYYEKIVPTKLQEEARQKQQAGDDYEEALNDPKRFALVHLHNKDGNFYFIAENRLNFFRAACKLMYGEYVEMDATAKYTLDSIAQGMCLKEHCDEHIYSVLEKAQEYDKRVASVLKIDYEKEEVAVQEYGKGKAKYRFDDIFDAASIAEYDPELSEHYRKSIFEAELEGKELEAEFSEPQMKL